jgi:hypothetical protein
MTEFDIANSFKFFTLYLNSGRSFLTFIYYIMELINWIKHI